MGRSTDWRERVSDEECFDVAVRLGGRAAAVEFGVCLATVHNRLKELGLSAKYCQARRDSGFYASRSTVAGLLGVSTGTVRYMILDGRLSVPFDFDALRRAAACTTLVVYREPLRWGKMPAKQCPGCGAFFTARRGLRGRHIGRSRYCTPECRERQISSGHVTGTGTKPVVPKYPRNGAFVAGACSVCATALVSRQQRGMGLYCSGCAAEHHRATQRILNQKRRAHKRGAAETTSVCPRQIFERDKWQCHICGEAIDKFLVFPDVGSATVDHLVPVSFGGEHSVHNVKAAHFGCNARRGNRGEFQTMLLIAA